MKRAETVDLAFMALVLTASACTVASVAVELSHPKPIVVRDELDPTDCSRGIDEANQAECDPLE